MNLKELFLTYDNQDEFVAAVNRELKKLIEENPNFCYVDKEVVNNRNSSSFVVCKYNGPAIDHETGNVIGNPADGCIFGQALQKLGWSDKQELLSQRSINNLISEYVCENFTYISTWPCIQAGQDNGNNWGSLIKYLE